MFKVLPYLVSNVIEVSCGEWRQRRLSHVACCSFGYQLLDIDPQDQAEEDGGHLDLDSQRKGKCAVIKTSTRQVCACVRVSIVSQQLHTRS